MSKGLPSGDLTRIRGIIDEENSIGVWNGSKSAPKDRWDSPAARATKLLRRFDRPQTANIGDPAEPSKAPPVSPPLGDPWKSARI